MYRIKVLDRIAPEGLALLGEGFSVSAEEAAPQGILVRSSGVDTDRYPGLLAVARGMVDAALLARLPAGAVLLNYARGEIVDEAAVLAALNSGHLPRYLTDFPSAAIIGHPKVLCSPHLGASTEESEEQCAIMAVGELKSYLEYGNVSRSVNFPTAEMIPAGNVVARLVMINRDVPGMIGFVSQAIGGGGINIASYLNESNGVIGYNLIDLEAPLPRELLARITEHPGVVRTRLIDLSSR